MHIVPLNNLCIIYEMKREREGERERERERGERQSIREMSPIVRKYALLSPNNASA